MASMARRAVVVLVALSLSQTSEAGAQPTAPQPLDCGRFIGNQARRICEAAVAGDATAQNRIGLIYFFGGDVPRDEAVAARWFGSAAVAGLAEAQRHLGLAYRDGRGLPADAAEARAGCGVRPIKGMRPRRRRWARCIWTVLASRTMTRRPRAGSA